MVSNCCLKWPPNVLSAYINTRSSSSGLRCSAAAADRLFPQQHTCFTIRHVGWAHVGPQQMAHRINDQKAFTAFDELTPIKANLPGGRRTVFNTLRVDDGDRRQGLFVRFNPVKHVTARAAPLIGNQQPRIVVGPLSKVPPGWRTSKRFAKWGSPRANHARQRRF